jgi:hypothetical protein
VGGVEGEAESALGGMGKRVGVVDCGFITTDAMGVSFMRYILNRHVVATIVAASCVGVHATSPASASMMEPALKSSSVHSVGARTLPQDFKTDAAQSGADAAKSGRDVGHSYTLPPIFASDAAQSGGDIATAPTTIEVVRSERTIVRDVDEALPMILSGTALALALAGLAMTLIYVRMLPRAGRSH